MIKLICNLSVIALRFWCHSPHCFRTLFCWSKELEIQLVFPWAQSSPASRTLCSKVSGTNLEVSSSHTHKGCLLDENACSSMDLFSMLSCKKSNTQLHFLSHEERTLTGDTCPLSRLGLTLSVIARDLARSLFCVRSLRSWQSYLRCLEFLCESLSILSLRLREVMALWS